MKIANINADGSVNEVLGNNVVELSADALSAMSTEVRANLYEAGARMLKITNGDTIVVLSLSADGGTGWVGCNKPTNNYLDNSDFSNPVNQRGKTTYTGGKYGIDRWRTTGVNSGMSVEDGYMRFVNTTNTNMFRQDVNDVARLAGKTFTLAAMVSPVDGSTPSVYIRAVCSDDTYEYSNGNRLADKGIAVCSIDVPDDVASIYLGVLVPSGAQQEADIYWAALYEGKYTADTLPPYTPKDHSAEMLECYRYYYFATTLLTNGCLSTSAKSYYMPISLPIEMREKPKIGADTKWRARLATGGYSAKTSTNYTVFESASVEKFFGTSLCLCETIATAVDPNNIAVSFEISNLELSADL